MRTIKPDTADAYDNNIVAVVSISNLNIRKGPGKKFASIGFIEPGTYEISETVETEDSTNGYGRIADGSGWISMDFVELENYKYVTGSIPSDETEATEEPANEP